MTSVAHFLRPVSSPREDGPSVVTAPGLSGQGPATHTAHLAASAAAAGLPIRRRRNPYAPSGTQLPLEWFDGRSS